MGASSDIDHLINECLIGAVNTKGTPRWDEAAKIITDRMAQIRDRFQEDAKKVDAVDQIEDLIELYNVYTSVDRLNLLRKLLDGDGKHDGYSENLKLYATSTVPKRNTLAHVRVQRDGFSRKLVDKKGNELTSDVMRELRQDLLGHYEKLEELAQRLKE